MPAKFLIDTDVGDDIDDAFALALALSSPDVDLVGVTTASGDTRLRARMVLRLLEIGGRAEVPVGVGDATPPPAVFSQKRFALQGPELPSDAPAAVDLILNTARAHPGQVTLLAIGPLTNIAAAIARDAAGFALLKRVVVMGGSIHRGYELPGLPARGLGLEHNFRSDPKSAAALFNCGVRIALLPLDATILSLDAYTMRALYSFGAPLTDALALLQWQWGGPAPTLFDPIALAYALDPSLCRTGELRIEIGDDGASNVVDGRPNATVCLDRDADACLKFILPRLMSRPDRQAGASA